MRQLFAMVIGWKRARRELLVPAAVLQWSTFTQEQAAEFIRSGLLDVQSGDEPMPYDDQALRQLVESGRLR